MKNIHKKLEILNKAVEEKILIELSYYRYKIVAYSCTLTRN